MEVIGLKEMRAVTVFTAPPRMLETKLRLELQSSRVPEPVNSGSLVSAGGLHPHEFVVASRRQRPESLKCHGDDQTFEGIRMWPWLFLEHHSMLRR